jgi:hypothetical protein
MDDVFSIKLLTGEEIIGRLKEKNDAVVVLEKPVLLAVTAKGLGFAPVCISIDDTGEIAYKQEHILFSASTRSELVDQYIKATTGIQLATSLK